MKKLFRIVTVPIYFSIGLKDQLAFISKKYKLVGFSSKGDEFLEARNREKIPIKIIPLTRKITPIQDVISVFSFFFLLLKERPLIVHSETPKAGIVGMLAAWLARIPIRMHTVAGLPLMEATGNKRKLLNFVERLTYFCATNVYPNSEGLKNFIEEQNFCASSKLKVLGSGTSNGIDTDYFSLTQIEKKELSQLKIELGISDTDFVFVFVGRMVGDKGINELVEAFSLFSEKHSIAKLILVGGFEEELDPLKEETKKKLECSKNILSVGFQKDVRPYYAIARCFVFPSYREGFPNAVMQAGAMELPSIVSDINGCNEIIIEEQNGLIIPPKDIQSLYLAMIRIFEEKELRKKMKQKSRPTIVSKYKRELFWEALLEEYKRLEQCIKK